MEELSEALGCGWIGIPGSIHGCLCCIQQLRLREELVVHQLPQNCAALLPRLCLRVLGGSQEGCEQWRRAGRGVGARKEGGLGGGLG